MAYKVISGLYKVINNVNGKYYIGASKNIKSSFAGLRSDLKNKRCVWEYLQFDWDEYGASNFKLEIILEIPNGTYAEIMAMKVDFYNENIGDSKCYNIGCNPVNGAKIGELNLNNKKVVCINTGCVFDSMALANGYHGACDSNISISCNTRHRTSGRFNGIKLCWEHYDNYIAMSIDEIDKRIDYANTYNANTGRKLSEEQKQKMRKPRTNKENLCRYSEDEIENKKLTLIEELKRFNSIYGRMPKSRELVSANGWSTQNTYIKYFGNVANAWIEAGFTVPKKMKKLIGRNNQATDEEYLKIIKDVIDSYYKVDGNIKLPSIEYIVSNADVISESGVYRRFGSVENCLGMIGYTKQFEEEKIKKDMIEKYFEIMNMIGRTPNSRDLEGFSRNNDGRYYAMSTYENWFGGIYDLQKELNVEPTIGLGRIMTKEEVIENLYKLYDTIGEIPTQNDIINCKELPNMFSVFAITGFSSMGDLQTKLFGETYSKVKITKNGTKCLSQYEYTIARVLEKYNYDFKKDIPYKRYMELDRKLTVDFVINRFGKIYFIEVFGMTGNKNYEKKTDIKIKLCKQNNIPLLEIYPEDFFNMNQEKWNKLIHNFLEQN